MNKVLLVNGSPNERGCTYTALREMADTLEKCGVEAEILWLGKKALPDCIDCGACRKTGECFRGDVVNDTLARIHEFDGIVLGSPVYYSGPSGQICSFLDRLFYSSRGRMAGKLGAAVVSCRRGGATAAFDRLNKYFGISGMHVVGSQYWNQVHGNTPEEVLQDAEGLQTMRSLARNMAWLIRCIEAGRQAGVPFPEQETKVSTNFIR